MYSAGILPLVCFGPAVEKNVISILYEVIVLFSGVSGCCFCKYKTLLVGTGE